MDRTLAEYLAQAPVFLRTVAGEILYWTAGCEALYGFTADEAIGQISHSLLATEFPEPLPRICARLEQSGQWRGRLKHVRKDGREIWTESLWLLRRAENPAGRLFWSRTPTSQTALAWNGSAPS